MSIADPPYNRTLDPTTRAEAVAAVDAAKARGWTQTDLRGWFGERDVSLDSYLDAKSGAAVSPSTRSVLVQISITGLPDQPPSAFDDPYPDIPDAMKRAERWLLWRSEPNAHPHKKPRKAPYYATGKPRSGVLDRPEDIAQFVTYEQACQALQQTPGYAGLGFALGPDGAGQCWQGVDLDHLNQHPGLKFVAEDLPGYTEESPSGSGVHAIGYGRQFVSLGSNSTGIEAYCRSRYFTVTGKSTGLGELTCLAGFVEGRLAPLHSQRAQDTSASIEAAHGPAGSLAGAMATPDLRSALASMRSDDRDLWIRMGHALKALGDQGRDLWLEWSQTSPKYDPADAGRVWDSFKPDRTGYQAVFAEAQRRGWANPAKARELEDDPTAPEFTEERLALGFAGLYAERLRWVQTRGKWMDFDGQRWRAEDTLLGMDLARGICRQEAARCNKAGLAKILTRAQTVAAVERLAKADRRLAATADQWDADPWALNTPGGVILLRSGQMRPHRPIDFMTRITSIAPGGDCPLWLRFLARVTGGDKALAGFLQRMAGYALTGDVSEHALFFGHGTGANGKSVFVETLAGILGDYHWTSPIETFTASQSDRHLTELAALQGARLVTSSETEVGRGWAESRIKSLTGGDRITARFMRQDQFTYPPQFKLLICGNHKPGLQSVDEAIRRRFHLIPFAVTVPLAERDPDLTEKLRTEWPGILAWMIQGCLDWQAHGLDPPDAVQAATEEYLQAEDMLAVWLDENCEVAQKAWATSQALFASWSDWSERANEPKPRRRQFADALQARGFKSHRGTRGERGFLGLKLKPWSSAG